MMPTSDKIYEDFIAANAPDAPSREEEIAENGVDAVTEKGRTALASSETVPEGSVIEFTIIMLDERIEPLVRECLDYGALRGIGQWRNAGKGTFTWEEIN